jgi:hypothetical protein
MAPWSVGEFQRGAGYMWINPSVAKKNDIETGWGYWKSLAAAPVGVGYMRFQVKPGLHLK